MDRAARLGQPVVVGRDDAALARRQVLARLERERRQVAEGAGGPVLVARAVRVRGVLDDDQLPRARAMAMMASMSAGWPAKWTGMIARVRGVMARLDGCGIEVERVQVDVGEHRNRVGLDHGGGGREERVGRDDDLVLGADARRHQRDAQRDGAVDDGDAVLAAVHRGEALLELGDLRAVQPAPLAAAQARGATASPRPRRRSARR